MMIVLNSGGNIFHAHTVKKESEEYSGLDIAAATLAAKLYFAANFRGCELIEIGYAGDESLPAAREWEEETGGKVMILTSSFKVDDSGGDGSLEPDSTYEGWQWIMVRYLGFLWLHKDHGYG